MAVIDQCGFVVFGAVHHALLQRGVEFAKGDGGRVGAKQFDHFHCGRAGLDADFHAFEIIWGFDGFAGVEGAAARVIVGNADEAFVFGGVQDFFADVAGEDVVKVRFVFEDVGQVEDAVKRMVFAASVMIYGGCLLTAKTFANAQVTPALQVPMGYVYLVVPLAGALLVFFSLVAVVDELKREG